MFHSSIHVLYTIYLHCLTGPSTQTNVASHKVVFNDEVTFSEGGSGEIRVDTPITNDAIALEADEQINVELSIISPTSGPIFERSTDGSSSVRIGEYRTTLVTIVDDDCKF